MDKARQEVVIVPLIMTRFIMIQIWCVCLIAMDGEMSRLCNFVVIN